MTIPTRIERIAQEISATVTENDRAILGGYLSEIKSDEELFQRCVRKAVRALDRFMPADVAWLKKWLPIILRQHE